MRGLVNWFQRLVLVGAIIGIIAVYLATPPVYVAGGGGWTNPQFGGGHQTLVPVADVHTLSARWDRRTGKPNIAGETPASYELGSQGDKTVDERRPTDVVNK